MGEAVRTFALIDRPDIAECLSCDWIGKVKSAPLASSSPEGGSALDARFDPVVDNESDVKAAWAKVIARLDRLVEPGLTDGQRRDRKSDVLGAIHVQNAARNFQYMSRWFSGRDALESKIAALSAQVRSLRDRLEKIGLLAEPGSENLMVRMNRILDVVEGRSAPETQEGETNG